MSKMELVKLLVRADVDLTTAVRWLAEALETECRNTGDYHSADEAASLFAGRAASLRALVKQIR